MQPALPLLLLLLPALLLAEPADQDAEAAAAPPRRQPPPVDPDQDAAPQQRRQPPRQQPAQDEQPQQPRRPAPPPRNQETANRQNGARANDDGIAHLSSVQECASDIHKYCQQVDPASDVAMIECLQDAGEREEETLESACEHTLWEFKLNLTMDERFHNAAAQFCSAELQRHRDCGEDANNPVKGHMLSCLLDYKENMTVAAPCRKFLSRVERIAFSDFRLVGSFLQHCRSDVAKHQCGSLSPPGINSQSPNARAPIIHSQGSTMQCLIERLVAAGKDSETVVEPKCRHEILRIAELQSDDFHLDRPLYFACRADREKICPTVEAGEGRVFQCLLNAKSDPKMSPKCSEHLVIRAQLIAQDYKVSHTLVQACGRDIQSHNCLPQGEQEPPEHFYLSYIVLCLENAARAAGQDQRGQGPLANECSNELMEHRRLLMSDYRMSPELVLTCAQDIQTYCGNRMENGGRTLHCLMGVEERKGQQGAQAGAQGLTPQCRSSIENLIKAADPGADYRVDVVLYESCRDLIDGECRREAGSEPEVLSCLMGQVDSPKMTDACEERLLEIQYFLSRDFSLDPQLYQACHDSATRLCSAPKDWWQPPSLQNQPHPGPSVLACLYRHAYVEEEDQGLDRRCTSQVRRVLRERAANVRLIPEVEENCRLALSTHCSTATQPGEEWTCLQEKMEEKEFREENKDCTEALERFTEMESKDVRLNRALTKSCAPVISAYCADLMEEEIDSGDVMECLVEHKGAQEMNSKCRAFVTHFQLISMKDYTFSYKFKKACAKDIADNCAHSSHDKGAIIRCLSGIQFEHRILKEGPSLHDRCKKQLRVEYLETEKLDAEEDDGFWQICKSDIQNLKCYTDGTTLEEAVECLRENKDQMKSDACHQLVFGRELMEAEDNRLDHKLMSSCKAEMDTLCRGVDPGQALDCLREHVTDAGMSAACAETVAEREEESANDIRLRPSLLAACEADAMALCKSQAEALRQTGAKIEEQAGEILYCLRANLVTQDASRKGQVSVPCQLELKKLIMEGEVDPKVDPKFYKACEKTIHDHCGRELFAGGSHGHRLECIKTAYYKGLIKDKACETEMGRRTAEKLADIHLDPVLHEACSGDISRYCKDTPPGQGRVVQCLMAASKTARLELEPACHNKLVERDKLWMAAHEKQGVVLPVSLGELAQLALASPERNSILSVFFFAVGILFVVGLCFGRVTKRVRREIKDR